MKKVWEGGPAPKDFSPPTFELVAYLLPNGEKFKAAKTGTEVDFFLPGPASKINIFERPPAGADYSPCRQYEELFNVLKDTLVEFCNRPWSDPGAGAGGAAGPGGPGCGPGPGVR